MPLEPAPNGGDGGRLVGEARLGQPKRSGETGVVGGESGGSLRLHPPHHLVLRRMAVEVLDGELGLAHPAQPGDRLSHGRRLAGVESLGKAVEKRVAAGEKRIPQVRDVPDGGEGAGELRPYRRLRNRSGAREPGSGGRFRAALADAREQGFSRRIGCEPHELDIDDRTEQTLGIALAYPHWEQESLGAGRVPGEEDCPLWSSEGRS